MYLELDKYSVLAKVWMTLIDWYHLEEHHPNIIHIEIYIKNKEPLSALPINLSERPRLRCQDLPPNINAQTHKGIRAKYGYKDAT